MARSIIPAMPRCLPGGRASSPQGAQPSVRQQPRLRHPPIWHGLAGPEHAALLVTIVRAALLPVHHYLPRAAARLLSVCVKAVRFPAGAWPPHHGRAALPRPGQARPGLLRLLPAGGGHRMTCRAGLRGFLRGTPLPSRYTTLPSSGARKRRAGGLLSQPETRAFLPASRFSAAPDLRTTRLF